MSRTPSAARMAAALVVLACTDSPSAPRAVGSVRLSIVSGSGQSGQPGAELSAPLVVLATDSKARPLAAKIVNFRVTSGGGSMFAGSGITDKSGVAQDYWTLGMTGTQTVEVRAVDPTTGAKLTFATFTATFAAPPDPHADGDAFAKQCDSIRCSTTEVVNEG